MSVKRTLLLLGLVLVILGGLVLGAVWAAGTAVSNAVVQERSSVCPDTLSPYACKVTPAFVEAVTGVELPDGTTVVSGGTSAWTSWNLYAIVAIPKGAAVPPEGDFRNTSVTYHGVDSQGRQLVSIFQTREAGELWPKP